MRWTQIWQTEPVSCSNDCATTESYTRKLLESSYGIILSCSWPNNSSDVVRQVCRMYLICAHSVCVIVYVWCIHKPFVLLRICSALRKCREGWFYQHNILWELSLLVIFMSAKCILLSLYFISSLSPGVWAEHSVCGRVYLFWGSDPLFLQ